MNSHSADVYSEDSAHQPLMGSLNPNPHRSMEGTDATPCQAEMESAVRNAVCRMADRVGLRGKDLAAILGVSPSYVSKMRRATATLEMHSHRYENALLLIRTLDVLWSLLANDAAMNRYLYSEHETLGAIPAEMMKRPEGLVDMTRYVESHIH
jgi:transcriptional regulator with XRE-family HTH domain